MKVRCMNCYLKSKEGCDYEAPLQKCPRCGERGMLMVPIVDTHLVVLDEQGPIATPNVRLRMACRPMRSQLATQQTPSMSGDPLAVTCEECKKTRAYAAAMEMRKTVPLRGPKFEGNCC